MVKLVPVDTPKRKLRLVPVDGEQQGATLGHKVGATIDGLAQGLTFNYSDEIAAGLSTGFGLAGDYDQALADERSRMAENKELASGYSLAGELTGGLAGGVGLVKAGLSTIPRLANAGIKARTLGAAAEGAAYGGAYASGAAEDNRLESAAKGALTGAAIGGAIPVVGAGVRGVGQAAYNAVAPKIRSVTNPYGEAARRVGDAFKRDITMQQNPLTKADEAMAGINGQEIRNFDRGGETVRALTRSVANQSPEARGVIEKTVSDRFAGQAVRAKDAISRIASGQVDDVAFRDQLRDAASRSNRGAYEKAFQTNFGQEHSMVFDELAKRVPASAMANAVKVAKAEGRPFGQQLIASIDEAADTVSFQRAPSIREWHFIQRGLRSAADSAYRTGSGEVGTAYKGLHRELLNAMDNANPDYAKARKGAASFFGADDALEAGQKFVMQNKNLRQSFQAIGKMKPAEREAFKIGFAGELTEKLSGVSDRRNVIQQIFGNENAMKKVEIAFGREGAKELHQFVKLEAAMDMMRGALGNSTTARQLVEMGLGAGGGYMATGDFTGAAIGAGLAKGARFAGAKADENVMRKVADILLSGDRKALAGAAKQVSKSKSMQRALDALMDRVEGSTNIIGSQQLSPSQ